MRSKRTGSFSLYGLLAMAVILIGSLGVAGFAANSMGRSSREQKAIQAFEAAQAGLEQATTNAFFSLEDNNGAFVSASYDFSDTVSPFAPGATVSAWVAPTSDTATAWVTSTALVDGARRSVRTLIREHNVGIWNNAIFAGTGASGHAINGNVDIRGSVHILGEGEPFLDLNANNTRDSGDSFTDKNGNGIWDPGEPYSDTNGDGVYTLTEPYNDSNQNGFYDPPMTQTDLNSSLGGTAYIGNNYSGMPADLEAMVPSAPRLSNIETLSAEVRCKHGRIGISGSASIGTTDVVDGGTSRSTIDGTYVTDGWAGNQGAEQVFSDNGTTNGYDVGGLGIAFPYISGIGAKTYKAKDGSNWSSHENYLDTRSLSCPVTTIKSDTAAFSYGPDAYGNRISFTPTSGTTPCKLTVTGVVKFNANLQIGGKDRIFYEGNGTMYAPNIYIDGDFVPAAGKVFPTGARVGLIARQNMYLATGAGSSQLTMAGAFYAQGRISSQKQNQIAGTFVANFYDMGTNVPNIYQVPSLPYNMPPAMPGDKSYYTLRLQGWRERTPAQIGGS